MDVSFTKRYASESEFLYDLAQSSPYFRQEDYKAFSEIEQSDVYTSTIAATRDKTSTTFDTYEYDLLAGQDRLSYLYNEYLQDKNETAIDEQTGETYNIYERNKEYLNARLDEAIDAKTFDSLNGFEKVMHTIGGVVGNALNTLFLGTTEGLLDVLSLGLGSFAAQIGWTEATDAITKFIAQDTTGYQKNQEELQRYARAYTYIDKSGFVNVINDVVSGITQMAPMLIPGVGAAIYFGGMAGNISEEAVRANPDINYWALMGYTAAVGSVEGLTEKISGAFFGGSAIDNLMFKSSKNVLGGWATRIGFNFASEGLEEAISEFADSVLYTAMVDPNAPLASIEEILYAGLIGGLIGGVTGAIEIGTAERLTINGKQLTKLESLAYQGQLQNAIELTKKSAVDSLMVKYSNLNIEQIKTQHAQEYQNAVEKDNATTRKLAEATIALAKLVDIAGVEKIQKAAKLVDYQIESYANLMKKYVARATSNIAANRAVEKKFATKNPGQSITINDVLTENQRKLKQELKSAYGIDAYFGNLGARDGLIKNNGLTLDEKTIVIDDRLFNEMSLDQIMTTVVREELVHTLQFGEGKLTKETLNKLREIYTQQGGKIQEGGDLDLAYSRSSTLTKQAELEAKAICQMLLFDEITISRVFSTNTNVFFNVFNTLKNLKKNIESKKTKRTNKDKVRFREILKAMGRYKDAAAHNIGNKEDLNMVADKMDLDDADKQDIADKMLPNYDTKHFTQLMDSFTMSVAKHKEATNFLMSKRQDDSIFFPKLDYSKVFDENYYTADFVQEIKNRNPEKDFRYNLQEAMINDFGFTINDKAGALMEVVDLTEMTTKDFRYDITDLAIDSSRIDKYTNLAQIFEPEFVRKFDSPFGNELEAIKINVVKTTSDTSTKATYNHFKGVITIKLNANKLTNFAESDALKHSILHETVHALSAIQNLAWGTSSKYIRSGLNVLPTKTINSLAEKLLTKEFYEQNKDNLDVLLDNIAYGIYRITDSEYAAEAYKTSKWRKNDIELKLKAGATMNRSGFYISDFGKLSGYGRFAGIEIKLGGEQLVSQENVKSKNLQDATEVVAYSRVSKFGSFLKAKGIGNLDDVNFSEDAREVLTSPDSNFKDVENLINEDIAGDEQATNLIIEFLIANKSKSRTEKEIRKENKYIKTIDDINNAREDGIAMALAYGAYRLTNDPNFDVNKPITYDELKKFFDSNKELATRILDKSHWDKTSQTWKTTSGTRDLVSNKIVDNKGLNGYLIRNDYDYSYAATSALMAAMTKGIGEVKTQSETASSQRKDESNDVNVIDKATAEMYREEQYSDDEQTSYESGSYYTMEDEEAEFEEANQLELSNIMRGILDKFKSLKNSPEAFTFYRQLTDSKYPENKLIKSIYKDPAEYDKLMKYIKSIMHRKDYYTTRIDALLNEVDGLTGLSEKDRTFVDKFKRSRDNSQGKYFNTSPVQLDGMIKVLTRIKEQYAVKQEKVSHVETEEIKTVEPELEEIVPQESKPTEIVEEQPVEKPVEKPVDEQPTEIDVIKQDIEHIQKVSSSEADSIVNAIINKYRTATTGISEAQFFDEETDMVYLKVGEQMESELSPFFAAVTDENYQAVRDGILTSKEFFADQALVLFDMYTLAVEGKFSPETRAKIQAYNRRALTKSAQRLNRQAKRVAERNGVSHLVSSFKENDINVTVTDKIVGDTFPELADKEKRISELEDEIKKLNKEIESMQDMSSAVVSLTEQRDELKSKLELADKDSAEAQKLQAKIDELTSELDSKTTQLSKLEELYEKQKELSTEIMVLENGTNEEIIDFFINKLLDKGILGSEKAAEKLKYIMEQLVLNATINRDGKEIGIYTYDAKGRPKPFPEVIAKIEKMAKKLQSFRMWSMLSSPITYVRNWIGNVGMRGLELATKKITRAIEKELSDEQYKEIIDKKENTKEILKVKRRIEKRNDKLKNEKISKEEKNKIEKQLEADEKILNNIKAIEGVDKSKDVDDLEKDILGYEFQENQFNLNTRKATDETVKYVNENFEKQIEAITSGTMKYTTDDANVQKAITTKEESLKIKAEQGTWWERAKAKAELYEIKGLETGWFGDRKFFRKSMTQNFADILESNKTNFIRRLEKERTRLEAKKNPTIDDLARLDEINFALKTQEMRDLVKYTPQTYINLLLDKAADMSRKQYFKNSNALSRFLADVGKKNPMLGTVVSFIMPFPKVAYNILATAIDYSPLGLIKGWLQGKTIQQMEKGNYKQMTGFEKAERAETLSKGAVGTMMFVAGALAAILGWVDVEEDDYLGLSLHINLGADIRISLSNLAPSMTTFSTAAAMIWAYKEDKGFNGIMKQALSTLYDNTLLGNIENIFAYGSLENWASNASISWISQYIPAVLKLVTKTIDPRKKDKSGNYWTKLGKTLASYTPGLSYLVSSKINPYTGDPMYNTGTDNFWVNFFTGISPLDIDVNNNYKSALQREAERIGATTTGYSGKFTVNGEDFIPEDKEKYAKYRANYISSQYQKIISGKEKVTIEDENGKRKTTTYDKLTDEQKKNVLNRLYSDAASKTKIKAWVEAGNYYYTSNRDEYNELRKLLNNNKIIYRSSWSKSKFVNK